MRLQSGYSQASSEFPAPMPPHHAHLMCLLSAYVFRLDASQHSANLPTGAKNSLRRAGTLHGPHGRAGCHQWGLDCVAARALKALLRGHARGWGAWEIFIPQLRVDPLLGHPGTHDQRHSCENRGAQTPPLPTYDDRVSVGAAPSPAQEGCAFASRCWPKA